MRGHILFTLGRGSCDGVTAGFRFLSNPDLVERVSEGYPPADYARSTFYSAASNA